MKSSWLIPSAKESRPLLFLNPADGLTSVGMGMTVMGVNGCPQGVFCMEQFE